MSYKHAENVAHTPMAVIEAEGMPFVRCSCDPDGVRPQSAVWLRDHWRGDQESGMARLRQVIASQAGNPEPWHTLGTHVDEPVRLEFSEATDESGLPRWERVIPPVVDRDGGQG